MNKIILAGMPNSGKSTVFNALTKLNAKVGNWHGVTVNVQSGECEIYGTKFIVCDLPGTYSLSPVTLEEKKSVDYISKSDGIIVYMVEAVTFPSAIKTVAQLIKQGKKVILAVNMVNELNKRGGKINVDYLRQALPCAVVAGEFNEKKAVEELKKDISAFNFNNNRYLNKNLNVADVISKAFIYPTYKESFFEKLTLSHKTAIPFFILVTLIVFYLSFGNYGLGKPLSDLLNLAFTAFISLIKEKLISLNVSEFACDLVCEGVLGSLSAVAGFLPQTLILSFALTVLEQTGYMSRLAYVSEGALNKTGLNGRAIFSVFMGFGCTAISTLSTGGLENDVVRKRAVLTVSTVPCSAKIPVIAYLASYSSSPFLFVFLVYATGFLITLVRLFIVGKFAVKGDRQPLLMELPPYRIPKFKFLVKSLIIDLKKFIIKICTVIFVISLAVFLLKSITPDFRYTRGDFDKSVLFAVGKAISFITAPIGVTDARAGVCIITGLFAKEGVLSAAVGLYPDGIPYEFASLYALTVLIYAYVPCLTAMCAIADEIGKKFALKLGVLQLTEALCLSYAAYASIKYAIIILPTAAVLILATLLIKKIKRKRYENVYGKKTKKIV